MRLSMERRSTSKDYIRLQGVIFFRFLHLQWVRAVILLEAESIKQFLVV